WKIAFDRYGFGPDTNRPIEASWENPPMGLKIDSDKRWCLDCTSCHSGPVPIFNNGQLSQKMVLGAPNVNLDLATFMSDRLNLKAHRDLQKRAGLSGNYSTVKGKKISDKLYFQFMKRFLETVGDPNASRGTITPWQIVAAQYELSGMDLSIGPKDGIWDV